MVPAPKLRLVCVNVFFWCACVCVWRAKGDGAPLKKRKTGEREAPERRG